jgi:hypothetical protein
MIPKAIAKEVRDFIEVPDRIRELGSLATSDLYFGPNVVDEDETYPGFSAAIKEIRAWADEIPDRLWVDSLTGSIWEKEPCPEEVDGEIPEAFYDLIYCIEGADILKILFNSELVEYL